MVFWQVPLKMMEGLGLGRLGGQTTQVVEDGGNGEVMTLKVGSGHVYECS